jgi:hypothetical protein
MVCLFKSVVYTEIGNGLNTLFASIPKKVTKRRLVKDVLHNSNWVQDVQGALSYAFLVQLLDLVEVL